MFQKKKRTTTTTDHKVQRLKISGQTEAVASSAQQRIYMHENLYFSGSDFLSDSAAYSSSHCHPFQSVQYSNTSTYTGLENLICLHRSNQNNTSTLFCITQISNDNNNEDLFTFFIDKLSNEKNKTSSNDIYALQIPTITSSSSSSISTYAQNLITQMRRIQPCGSYQIVAIRNKPEETIANEMLKQLKTHSLITNTQLHLLDAHN
ncbi:unnamed protein product [Adineta steineri]|uniref:Uncharacterized protein n=2 Tax=Adineta steineri TaxID=433720 RepID=A0A814ECA1_9BILA|nr:unnamed protein product [Adineta steineri]